jgi:hypothetical protein
MRLLLVSVEAEGQAVGFHVLQDVAVLVALKPPLLPVEGHGLAVGQCGGTLLGTAL